MNRGTKQTCNSALNHILVELDIACHGANGTKSNCALHEQAGHSSPGCIPRGRADGEGCTANVMPSDLDHHGLEVHRGSMVSGQVPVRVVRVQQQAGQGRGRSE
jgi:hypothetical protein